MALVQATTMEELKASHQVLQTQGPFFFSAFGSNLTLGAAKDDPFIDDSETCLGLNSSFNSISATVDNEAVISTQVHK